MELVDAFVDALLVAYNVIEKYKVHSFDKKLNKLLMHGQTEGISLKKAAFPLTQRLQCW